MQRRKVVNCTLGNIDQAILAVSELRKTIDVKAKTICERLANIGVNVASVYFSNAVYDGDKLVNVEAIPTENGYIVSASGQSVAFIEFGSGAMYGGGYPLQTMEPHVDTNPGSWSLDPEVGKGHYADPKGWYYEHGKKSHGNKPTMAMYFASKEVHLAVNKIAREVLQQ